MFVALFDLCTAALVHASFSAFDDPLEEGLNYRHYHSDYHRANDRVANNLEPSPIEVPKTTTNKAKCQWACRHVRID